MLGILSDNEQLETVQYELGSLSFSEFARVRIALFIACAEQFMHGCGTFFNVLVIDECFAGVDAFGVILLLTTLRAWACVPVGAATEKIVATRSVFFPSAIDLTASFGPVFDTYVQIDRFHKTKKVKEYKKK